MTYFVIGHPILQKGSRVLLRSVINGKFGGGEADKDILTRHFFIVHPNSLSI